MNCAKCKVPLTPEEKLLSAMFGPNPPVCTKCGEKQVRLTCCQCNEAWEITVNGHHFCLKHAGELYK